MPPITEAQLFEAFGLDPKGSEGAQEQTPAESVAEDTGDTGVQEQELAEPAEDITEEEPMTDPEPETGREPETGKKPLTPEERRANAARRRQEEQQAAVDAAVRAEQARMNAQLEDVFRKAGLKNTVTGEPIRTMEEFQNWYSQFQTTQMEQELKKGKLTPEMIGQIVEQNPVVQQAKQVMEQARQSQLQQQETADRQRVETELAQIRKLNPDIREFGDILKMETAPQFREYIGRGYRAIDAYRLANMEAIGQAQARQAAQAAVSNLRGKEHLKAAGNGRGSGDVSVPPGQMRMFRALNPGKSDAEIIKYYNNHLKSKGG